MRRILPLIVTLFFGVEALFVGGAPPILAAVTITEFPVASPNGPGPITSTDNHIWFTEPNDDTIGRISPTGVVTEYPLSAGFQEPRGIAAAPDGTVWFTETGSHEGAEGIERIDASGTIAQFPVPDGTLPFGITTGPDGNVWFTRRGFPSGIARMTSMGEVTNFPAGLHNAPLNIVTGPDGALWFTEDGIVDGGSGAIGRITTSGSLTEYVLPTPAGASSGAGDIAVGSDGNLWFTWATQASPDLASVSRSIGRITPAGVITEFPVSSGHGWPSGGIAAGPDGNLWFTTGAANTVASISTSGTIEQYPVPTANSFPIDVVAGPDGNVWFSEASSSKIGRVNLVSGSGVHEPGSGVHERRISFEIARHLVAKGRVTATEGVSACWQGVSVTIQRRVEGKWRSAGKARTDANGVYRVQLRDHTGTYRAKAPKVSFPGGDVCTLAISRTRRHHHARDRNSAIAPT